MLELPELCFKICLAREKRKGEGRRGGPESEGIGSTNEKTEDEGRKGEALAMHPSQRWSNIQRYRSSLDPPHQQPGAQRNPSVTSLARDWASSWIAVELLHGIEVSWSIYPWPNGNLRLGFLFASNIAHARYSLQYGMQYVPFIDISLGILAYLPRLPTLKLLQWIMDVRTESEPLCRFTLT